MTTRTTRIPSIDEKEGASTMTTKKKSTTGYVTQMRRCAGSARFGIDSHEAPISTFPKQPSRKDGLGVMCSEHWKMYVKGLREARLAAASTEPQAAKATTKPKARKATVKPSAKADGIAKAEKLIAEVDTLPADEHVARVADVDVQAALETTAGARMLAD